ncbi:family 43 glycosylhydrolase [Mesobacillus foraminis]|uniref:Glycosyl hydrolase family 43 n=1 Tax=Mesobacillus foraminis TaxID=279826 RepID=A0A4R2B3F0_9BACI|nr:family 43 glycosylhydrolase [Mesobacillus foraminis]TCN19709.1 glycosyl hydrolase family 43 [Mesobacillus foraminis]
MKELVNGGKWLDQDGNLIHAHGGHILFYNDYYYWYGEDRRNHYYVSCYRSKDLFTWEFRNHILTTDSPTSGMRIRTKLKLKREDGGKVNLERPKVLFNEKTKQFVLWVHFENGENYKEAACAIATSNTPDGDFTYHGHFNPLGYMSRDCTLYQDDDGTAYFISAARDNADLHIYRLQDDYLNIEKLVAQLWQGEYREAPAVIKDENVYYMCNSFCTGWAPNQGKFGFAKKMGGPWSVLQDFGDETTYLSQPAFILKTQDGQLFYFGDRWDAKDYFNSSYVVLPLEISNQRMAINYYEKAVLTDSGKIKFTNE